MSEFRITVLVNNNFLARTIPVVNKKRNPDFGAFDLLRTPEPKQYSICHSNWWITIIFHSLFFLFSKCPSYLFDTMIRFISPLPSFVLASFFPFSPHTSSSLSLPICLPPPPSLFHTLLLPLPPFLTCTGLSSDLEMQGS